MITVPGVHKRIPNGILGLRCKLHYPDCMEIGGQLQPASSWDHYIVANDVPDQEGRIFENKAGAERAMGKASGTTFLII